jgi:hypothetical protein
LIVRFAFLLFILAYPVQAEVYLSPVDGTGTDANPFKSRCFGIPGGRGVDLRADSTQATGYMLCESNNLPVNMTGVVVIGSTRKATLTSQTKSELLAATSKTIVGTTVEAAIKELVIPILPANPKSGSYDIYLGKTQEPVKTAATWETDVRYRGFMMASYLWGTALGKSAFSSNDAWATVLSTETWNCADNASLTCVLTWNSISGTAFDIVSNTATAAGSATSINFADHTLASNDNEAWATVVNVTTGGSGTNTTCSVFTRNDGSAQTFYRQFVQINNSGELNATTLSKTVAGASTQLDTDTTNWVANDINLVSANGTTITGKVNGVALNTATDSAIASGTYAGIRYFSDSASGGCTLDNFGAQDITVASVTGVLRRRVP